MVFYQLHIFNRQGKCLYMLECNRRKNRRTKPEQDHKLMFGLLHSLKSFVTRLNPVQQLSSSASSDAVEVSEPLQSYTTGGYKLHYFESLTGLRFVLTTDPAVDSAQDVLKQAFALYAEYVVKNPLYTIGDAIDCPLFVEHLSELLKKSPSYA